MTVLQANNLLLSRLANQCSGLLQTFCSLTLYSSRKRLINIYTLTQYLQERAITEACVWSYSELITFLARYPFKQSFSAFFSAFPLITWQSLRFILWPTGWEYWHTIWEFGNMISTLMKSSHCILCMNIDRCELVKQSTYNIFICFYSNSKQI